MPKTSLTKKAKRSIGSADADTMSAARHAAMDKLQAATDELHAMSKEAKRRYHEMDPHMRKKVVAGIAGAAALLAAAVGVSAAKKAKKKRQ